MNKILKNIIGAIALIVILLVFYLLTFQLSHERLIVKESKAVISIGDLNSKKANAYYELYEKATQTDFEEAKKWTKYIKGIDLIYYDDSQDKNQGEDKEIMVVNIGWLYPIAKFKQGEYFDDLGKKLFFIERGLSKTA
jgi:GH25 family lysozyme M1 (1,4-beta-N-acetylmuramidase)